MIINEESKLSRKEVCARLETKGIQTRPISGSHLARQPAWKGVWNGKIRGTTPVADAIHERGFFVGQSHAFGDQQGELLVDTLKDFCLILKYMSVFEEDLLILYGKGICILI